MAVEASSDYVTGSQDPGSGTNDEIVEGTIYGASTGQYGQSREELQSVSTIRSYDHIALQDRANAIFGDVYGGVHYHFRPSHAIAQLPGLGQGQSGDTTNAYLPTQHDFPSWLLPFEQRDDCFGREELLDSIEDTLFGSGLQRRVAITGLGGAGKSRCAMEIAYRTRRKRPQYQIFWVQGTDLTSVQQAYRNIAEALHLSAAVDDDEKTMELVRSHLNSDQAREFLMIVDDADDGSLWVRRGPGPQSSRPLLMDYLPRSSKGATLVTTRSRHVAMQIAPKHVEPLAMLDIDSANLVLRSHLGNNATWVLVDASSICRYLMCLPYALIRAADFVNQTGISLQALLAIFKGDEDAVIEVLSAGSGHMDFDGDLLPIRKTWLVALEHIQQQDQYAFDIMAYMSCLHHASIPTEFLPLRKASRYKPDQSAYHKTASIGLLRGYGLLTMTGEGCNSRLDFHQLAYFSVRHCLRHISKLEFYLETLTLYVMDVLQNVPIPLEQETIQAYLLHVNHLYHLCKVFENAHRSLLLNYLIDLLEKHEMHEEELTCLELFLRDPITDSVFHPCMYASFCARLGHLYMVKESFSLANDYLSKAALLAQQQCNWFICEEVNWPQLVQDALLVWDRLDELVGKMTYVQQVVQTLLVDGDHNDSKTKDAIRVWIDVCLKQYDRYKDTVITIDDLEKLVRLSSDRLGEDDTVVLRAQCALAESQLQHKQHQQDKASVRHALTLFEHVLGKESHQSASARLLLENIDAAERKVEAEQVRLEAERVREAEIQDLNSRINQVVEFAKVSKWAKAAKSLGNLTAHEMTNANGFDQMLLEATQLYISHSQGRSRETMQRATDMLSKQGVGKLEQAPYLLLEDIACSLYQVDAQTAIALLLRLWTMGFLPGPTTMRLYGKLPQLIGTFVQDLRAAGHLDQAISLLDAYQRKPDVDENQCLKFPIKDYLFAPGLCSWPRWIPSRSSTRSTKSDKSTDNINWLGRVLESTFNGDSALLLMRERWSVVEILERLRLEATCPNYRQDTEQKLKTKALFVGFCAWIGVKTLIVFSVMGAIGVVVAAGFTIVGFCPHPFCSPA